MGKDLFVAHEILLIALGRSSWIMVTYPLGVERYLCLLKKTLGYYNKAIAASPVDALPGYVMGGLSWFAIPWLAATTMVHNFLATYSLFAPFHERRDLFWES